MTFNTLGLSETLLLAVQETGYTQPTSIQAKAIPAVLAGSDVMAAAQTGTGKTAGFTLPLMQLLSANPHTGGDKAPRALVLTPTRELAAQVKDSIETYGKHEKLRTAVVFGGVNINQQIKVLRRGVDILVATPGRLLDLQQQGAVKLSGIEILVLDEADRMLDMGFMPAIKRILALLPRQRQNLMFSATFSDEIRGLARSICRNPVEVDAAPRNAAATGVSQKLYMVDKSRKADFLSHLLRENSEQALVFSRTKHGADKLVRRLKNDDISATAIHGNKSQNQRIKALSDFKGNKVQVLVATDIAARGIDIDRLELVVNFDLPQVAEDYVHRIGRTGRAGATGQAISLVSTEENKQLRDIERLIKNKIERAVTEASFAPSREAAASNNEDRTATTNRSGARSTNRSTRARPANGTPNPRSRSAKRGASNAAGRDTNRPRSAPKEDRAQEAAAKPRKTGTFWKSLRNSMAKTA